MRRCATCVILRNVCWRIKQPLIDEMAGAKVIATAAACRESTQSGLSVKVVSVVTAWPSESATYSGMVTDAILIGENRTKFVLNRVSGLIW